MTETPHAKPPGSHAFHRTFVEPFAVEQMQVDADYLLFASSGTFVLSIASRQWLLPPQRAALIPRGLACSVRSNGPATSSSILFRGGEVTGLEDLRVFVVSDLARLMIGHAMRWDGDHAPDSDGSNFFAALAGVVGELATAEQNTWLPRPSSQNLRRAIDFGLADIDIDVPFEALAAAGAVSERTLARLFRSELDMNWSAFRHRARMIRAMELLSASAEDVTQIGLAVGFDSASSFIRAFRTFSGQTPHAYRQSGRRL
jgi:AraC-like DNA-binding protein